MLKPDTLPEVDIVERLMLGVGFRAIVSRTVERVTAASLDQAIFIQREIARLANDLVRGQLAASTSPEMNYRSQLKDLARGWDAQQLEETIAMFPPGLRSDGHSLVLKANMVIKALLAQYPIQTYMTMTGSENLVPDDVRVFKFVTVLEIIDSPLSVFSLMAEGALLQPQVKALRLVYPTLSQCIDAAILEATIHAKADKKSYQLPPRTEIGVRSWFGHGPLPPEILRSSQAAVARSNIKQQAMQQSNPQSGFDMADLTATEKSAARA